MSAKREARRKRDREDFVRATTQAVRATGQKIPMGSTSPGANAGNTYREHLEDKLTKAVASWHEEPTPVKRGMIRGLAVALALYENSYDYSTARIKKIEREFMED